MNKYVSLDKRSKKAQCDIGDIMEMIPEDENVH